MPGGQKGFFRSEPDCFNWRLNNSNVGLVCEGMFVGRMFAKAGSDAAGRKKHLVGSSRETRSAVVRGGVRGRGGSRKLWSRVIL